MEPIEQIIKRAETNIRTAVKDYARHTTHSEILDDCSETFVSKLAHDSTYAKQELRELFSKSPAWDENLDAIVINGQRTHDPDYRRIRKLYMAILSKANTAENDKDILDGAWLFADPEKTSDEQKRKAIAAINRLAPNAYAVNKKLSRVFKSLCVALGIADETAGSYFQKQYAQFADELSSKKIDFKLYVSINPAHFLTMSNPKYDDRGCTLTSCHSLNSMEYSYNTGCTGYARDNTSFIVFTASDPNNPETLNNRKTTRQIFAYKPGNGLLLQSRMYNTSGGVNGSSEDSKLYRDLIQREISMLENTPNLWKTYPYLDGHAADIITDSGYGGYEDWKYPDFDGKVSIRNDCADTYQPLTVGAYGLCIICGDETNDGVCCDTCSDRYDSEDYGCCDDCEERFSTDQLYTVLDENRNTHYVCEDCRDHYYSFCDQCENDVPVDCLTYLENYDRYVCNNCLREDYTVCCECGNYVYNEDTIDVCKDGTQSHVCLDCAENYERCDCCHIHYLDSEINIAHDAHGNIISICEDCAANYDVCPNCDSYIDSSCKTCPACNSPIYQPIM